MRGTISMPVDVTALRTEIEALRGKVEALTIHAGETIKTTYSVPLSGFLTNVSKDIYFIVPLERQVAANSVTATFNGIIRQNGVSLPSGSGENLTNTDFDAVTTSSVPGVGVRFRLTKNAGFGGTSNALVSIFAAITLTFS